MAFNFSFTGGLERAELAVPQLAGRRLQHAVLLHRARLRGRARSPSPGWSGAPGSACSCGRSGTTRTARAASACKAMRVKLTAFVISGAITAMIGAVWFYYIERGPAADRLRPAVRPHAGADGVPRRLRLDRGAGARRADHRAAHALAEHPARVHGGSLSEILLGAVFLIVVLFMPRGIIPTGGELITQSGRGDARGRPSARAAAASRCRPPSGRRRLRPVRSAREVPGDRPAAHRGDHEGLRRRPGARRRDDRRRGRHGRRA